MVLRRNDAQILGIYNELWDKVWWNRHQTWLAKIDDGEQPVSEEQKSVLAQAVKAAKRLEDKYGRENLGWDDFGAVSPGLEISQMRHEWQRARMFMS